MRLKLDGNTYRYHALLKEFLLTELERDASVDTGGLYKKAAHFFKEGGDILRALDMAAKSRDEVVLEECLRARYEEYGRFAADISKHVAMINKYVLSALPPEHIKRSLRLSLDCFSALFHLGSVEESYEWMDAAKKLLWSKVNARSDIISDALLSSLDPRNTVADVPWHFKRITPLLANALPSKTEFFSMTVNFPFFHRAQVDYSSISPDFDAFMEDVRRHMQPLFGKVFEPLIWLLEAGIHYERGELAAAERIAGHTVEKTVGFPHEIRFSALALQAEILRVQGKKYNTDRIGDMLTEAKASYLYSNFNAFAADCEMYNGGKNAAANWLEQTETEGSLKLYKIYQYFTTARALMSAGKPVEAEALLAKLITFTQTYRRSGDHIEALVLRAVCLWNIKNEQEAMTVMTEAIVRSQKLRLVMPVIKTGADALPILKKSLNRIKYGYDTEILDKAFVSGLYMEAQIMAKHYRGLMSGHAGSAVKLSRRQTEVIGYLKLRYSYKEIAEKIGVKVTTVDDHIDKLYEKLGAANANEAVAKAREFGLIN